MIWIWAPKAVRLIPNWKNIMQFDESLINHEFLTPESHIIKMLRGNAHDAQRKEVVR